MKRRKTVINKQSIISEYLSGDATFLELEVKHGVKSRTIQSWVRAYRLEQNFISETKAGPKDLKSQLEREKLKNELLEEMLRLTQQQTGIDIRKKFGTRQS